MTLESKIQERAKAIQAEAADSQKKAEAATAQLRAEFEEQCKALVALVKSIGVKGEITTPDYGESSVPYCSFTMLEIPVSLENRSGIVKLLINGESLPDNASYLLSLDSPKDLKIDLEATLTEAIAQVVAERKETEPKHPAAKAE